MLPAEASEATREIYADLPAFSALDPPEYLALILVASICAPALDAIHELVTDQEGRPGWQILFDPTLCPAPFLPWLAQVAGAQLQPQMSEAEQRAAITAPEAFGRGTRAAIEAAAKRRLTGTRSVEITERYTGDAWKLLIETDEKETPDPATTLLELEAAVPIGIVLYFNARAAWTWAEIEVEEATYPTWTKIGEAFATWADLMNHEP